VSAPALPPLETPRLAPFARLPVVLAWGLRRTAGTRKFALVAMLCVFGGWGLGALLARSHAAAYDLWEFLQRGVLGVAVPLVALGLVGTGFGEEVQDQTLVWHLVRPVSRTTVFVGRYAAGGIAGLACAAALALTSIAGSRVPVPAATAIATAACAALGTLTTGAVYYALAALFRRGLVAGLVYTFVVEGFFQGLPGTIQKLSLTHHVVSVFHRLTDAGFAPLSAPIAREVKEGPPSLFDTTAMRAVKPEPWTSLGTALLVCVGVALFALWLGARRVRRRDFALKD
jgi:ABC-type transport system involved in multi-copper enzyme maturation permease subunit